MYAAEQSNIAQPLLLGDSDSEESSIRIGTQKKGTVHSDQLNVRLSKPDKAQLKVSSTMSYGGYAPNRVEDVTAAPEEH